MSPLDLVGVADLGRMAGVSRQRASQLTQRPDFPKPVSSVSGRPAWRRAQVEAWLAAWPRPAGRPRAER